MQTAHIPLIFLLIGVISGTEIPQILRLQSKFFKRSLIEFLQLVSAMTKTLLENFEVLYFLTIKNLITVLVSSSNTKKLTEK